MLYYLANRGPLLEQTIFPSASKDTWQTMRAPAHTGHGTLLCKLLQCLKVLPERHVARRVQPLHRKGWSTN